jgi:uncharacterized protein
LRERDGKGQAPMTDTSTSRKPDAQEPSMDDILASIRRILADDAAAAPGPAVEPARTEHRPPADAPEDDFAPAPEPAERSAAPSDEDFGAAGSAYSDAPASRPSADVFEQRAAAAAGDIFMLSPEMRAGGHKLVSEQAAEDSTDVLSRLARAILDRRDMAVSTRDVTLEGIVREMLRPLLREWLDRNLPYLIERLVRKEIDLMVNRAERLED